MSYIILIGFLSTTRHNVELVRGYDHKCWAV